MSVDNCRPIRARNHRVGTFQQHDAARELGRLAGRLDLIDLGLQKIAEQPRKFADVRRNQVCWPEQTIKRLTPKAGGVPRPTSQAPMPDFTA